MRSMVLLCVALLSAACGKESSKGDDEAPPSKGSAGEVADTTQDGIASFLVEASYQAWSTKQPAPIESVSAHSTKTRTFFNDIAATATRRGDAQLPQGSVIVKEIFEADGTTLKAKALMAKTDDAESLDSWVWFEGFLPDFGRVYYGKDLSTCTGCHASGKDFVRTALPD